MTISALTSATAAATSSNASSSSINSQETFLNLLVTQLQNQDPMNPQDSQEFVAQLAQFTSVEQLISLNSGVDDLSIISSSINNVSLSQLIGDYITAYGDEFDYSGEGSQTLSYKADSGATEATVTVYDENGKAVYTEEIGALADGDGTWTWDGQLTDGGQAESGVYSWEIKATDADGEDISVSTLITGEVDGMSYETGTPVPLIGDVEVSPGDIIRIDKDKK